MTKKKNSLLFYIPCIVVFLLSGHLYSLFAQDLVVSDAQMISGAATYNNVIVQTGGVLTVDGVLTVNQDMVVENGGLVTHSQKFLAGLRLEINGNLEVQTGGSINVNGKGLLGGFAGTTGAYGEAFDENGQIVPGAAPGISTGGGGSGGSYGGQGGISTPQTIVGPLYGHVENPGYLGAGGGATICGGCNRAGGSGGGLVRIIANSILNEGIISANGNASTSTTSIGGGGSGGSVNIDVGSISGNGVISANGGEGRSLSFYRSGAGGGGRIALYYESNLVPEANITVFGGRENFPGAAGTIFLKDKNEVLGSIIIDNGNFSSAGHAILRTALSAFRDLNVKNGKLLVEETYLSGANLQVEDSIRLNNAELHIGKAVELSITLANGFDLEAINNSLVTFDSSAVINAVSIKLHQSTLTTFTDLDYPQGDQFELSNQSTLNIRQGAVFSIGSFEETNFQSGTLFLDSTSILDVYSNQMAVAIAITKDGKFGTNNELASLVLKAGGKISHSQRYFPGLSLKAQLLEVQENAEINVNGKGLLGGFVGTTGTYGETFDENGHVIPGAGPGINYIDPGWGGAGGTYGGQGGIGDSRIPLGSTYGAIESPDFLGAGGGGSPCGGCDRPGANGGGRISIEASTLIVDGSISANGAGELSSQSIGGGGSGGSIKINANSIAGTGMIRANGGEGRSLSFYRSGAGGGGRIAIFYDSNLVPESNITAFGGNEYYAGAAGTIYLKSPSESGMVIIDNGNRVSQSKTSFHSQLDTIRSLKVAHSASLQLSPGSLSELTVQDTLLIESSAVASLDSTFTLNIANKVLCSSAGKLFIDSAAVLNAVAVQVKGGIFETEANLNFSDGNDFELADGGQVLIGRSAVFNIGHFDAGNIQSGLFTLSDDALLNVASNEIAIGDGVTFEKDGKFGEEDFINVLDILQGGTLTSTNPGLAIHCNYFTLYAGALITHKDRDEAGLSITAREKLEIKAGGSIDVSQKGLRGGLNGSIFGATGEAYSEDGTEIVPGAGFTTNFAGGGSYGGLGAVGVFGGDPNPVYGDKFYPEFLGSGGSSHPGFGAAGHGGGRVTIFSKELIVDGNILANGGNGGSHAGGGSGGSVLVYANSISGGGLIGANGGNGGCGSNLSQCSGSGGGGRLAIYTEAPDFPVENISANPGVNNANLAEEGTIVYKICSFENNAGLDTILVPPPLSILPQDTTISPVVVVRNYSPNDLIFPVSFQIGAFYLDESYVNLKPGEQDTIVFSPWAVVQTGTVMATVRINAEIDNCAENNEKQLNIGIDSGEGPVLTTVSPGAGGNTGSVTVRMTGLHFDPGIRAWLEKADGSGTNFAHYVEWKNGGSLYASFNLMGLEPGLFDVYVQNPDGQEALLEASFSIEKGPFMAGGFTSPECLESSFDLTGFLDTKITHPRVVRRFSIFPVTVEFINTSNIDIPLPTRTLISIQENPVSFSKESLEDVQIGDEDIETTLLVRFEETGGPANILRAGATGTFKFYCKAMNTEAKFKITE